jgi:hypothetical protein
MTRTRAAIYTLVVAIALLAVPTVSAQNSDSLDFQTYTDSFSAFADDIADSLPMNSTVGLNTSDAYIGQLLEFPPSIGVGATVGFSTIPVDTVKGLFGDLNIDTPEAIDQAAGIGLPVPALAGDLRVGGIILPFDLGVKYGTVVQPLADQIGDDYDIDYQLIGFDVRVPVVKERFLVPSVSVGAGYNRLNSDITVRNLVDTGFSIDLSEYHPEYVDYETLSLSNPELNLNWSSNVIDAKAQASMNLWILTPYVGAGASYSRSSVGGGLIAALQGDGQNLSDQEVEDLKDNLREYENQTGNDVGVDIDQLSADKGITVERMVEGYSFRVFGGTSLNLLIFRMDMGVGYDLLGKNFSGNVGLRVQF